MHIDCAPSHLWNLRHDLLPLVVGQDLVHHVLCMWLYVATAVSPVSTFGAFDEQGYEAIPIVFLRFLEWEKWIRSDVVLGATTRCAL